jgi:hypothetical protein
VNSSRLAVHNAWLLRSRFSWPAIGESVRYQRGKVAENISQSRWRRTPGWVNFTILFLQSQQSPSDEINAALGIPTIV